MSVAAICSHTFTRSIHEPGIIERAAEKGWGYHFGQLSGPPNPANPSGCPDWHITIFSLFAEWAIETDAARKSYRG